MREILVLLKPDIVAHKFLAKVTLAEILAAGVEVRGAKKVRLTDDTARQLYAVHREKFFYQRLLRHVTSGDVIAMKVVGDVRAVIGGSKTWPRDYEAGLTTRQRFALSDVRNVAHASDAEEAPRELSLFEPFPAFTQGLAIFDDRAQIA
ncbi:unnamed protein product [Caenorhabditis auriculariae]|uniref:Nucleoside diphosphate kinase n=1 Tax=Caenorhabditis auriculariae TaxID=2777116 RepID=A0A8S1GU94_9PELO|nr:unnamed protein product [Caenorhabditis auriculariae]